MVERKITWNEVINELRDGDILLFKRLHRLESWLIGVAGRGEMSHAEMAVRWGSQWVSVGMDSADGGRALGLAKLVRWYPGRIELYRVHAGADRARMAAKWMTHLLNQDYDHRSLFRLQWLHAPVLRLLASFCPRLLRWAADDKANGEGGPKHCSGGVAWSWRQAGCDLVPNLADPATEPNDLKRSALCDYQFTLYP